MKDFRKKAIINLYEEVLDSLGEYNERAKKNLTLDELSPIEWETLVDEFIKGRLSDRLTAELENSYPEPLYLRHILTTGARLLEIIHDNWVHHQDGKDYKVRWDFIYEQLIGELEKLFGGRIMVWVNVYKRERRYGGAEEGGWYYDWNTCIASHEVSYTIADRIAEECEEYHGIGEGDISSVLGGHEIYVRIEDMQAENEDTEVPYYS